MEITSLASAAPEAVAEEAASPAVLGAEDSPVVLGAEDSLAAVEVAVGFPAAVEMAVGSPAAAPAVEALEDAEHFFYAFCQIIQLFHAILSIFIGS